jgi:hypothetical protein
MGGQRGIELLREPRFPRAASPHDRDEQGCSASAAVAPATSRGFAHAGSATGRLRICSNMVSSPEM